MFGTPALHQLVTLGAGATCGGSCWSVTPASCKPSAGAACSTSCAPTAGSTSSNGCTASPTVGGGRLAAAARRRPSAFDAYEAHGRIIAGTLDEHLDRIATTGSATPATAKRSALVASTNDHVDAINGAVQQARLTAGHLDRGHAARSPAASTPTSVTSWPPAATTGG